MDKLLQQLKPLFNSPHWADLQAYLTARLEVNLAQVWAQAGSPAALPAKGAAEELRLLLGLPQVLEEASQEAQLVSEAEREAVDDGL